MPLSRVRRERMPRSPLVRPAANTYGDQALLDAAGLDQRASSVTHEAAGPRHASPAARADVGGCVGNGRHVAGRP